MPTGSGIALQYGFAEEAYVNEVMTLTGTPSAIFGLIFDGAATPVTIPIAATSVQVQSALEALPNIGVGNVVCTGGALPAAITCTFSGPPVAGRNLPLLAVSTGITGLTPATTVPGTGYGDVATPTRFLEITDESVGANYDRLEDDGIRPGNLVLRADRTIPNKKGASGDINGTVPSKGFGLVLKHATGKVGTITTPVGATNTRRQTYAGPGDGWNLSLTMQEGIPTTLGDANNVKPYTYPGTKIVELDLTCDLDGFLKYKLVTDAMDETTATALAAASYAAAYEVFGYGLATLTIAGANVFAKKLGFNLKRPLATDRRGMRANTLKRQPIANGLTEAIASFTLEFEDLVQYNRFAAATAAGLNAAVVLTFQGSLIEVGFPYQLQVSIPIARFDADSPKVGGIDLVTVDYTAKALNDGTNPPWTIIYDSLDAAA
jgi:hypothetical protein